MKVAHADDLEISLRASPAVAAMFLRFLRVCTRILQAMSDYKVHRSHLRCGRPWGAGGAGLRRDVWALAEAGLSTACLTIGVSQRAAHQPSRLKAGISAAAREHGRR